MPVDRRLAAILVADVAGYSALMERDEAGTFDRLRLTARKSSSRRSSSTGAVSSSLRAMAFWRNSRASSMRFSALSTVQRQMEERNRSLPEDNDRVRIGINLGDVIVR